MSDLPTGKTIDWKDRYFKTLLEIEDIERRWSKRAAKIGTDLRRLGKALGLQQKDLVAKLSRLNEASAAAEFDVLWEECIGAITTGVLHGQSDADSLTAATASISKALTQMLENFDVLPAVEVELNALKSALATAPSAETVERAVTKISRWICDLERRRAWEQQESTRYLQRVSTELVMLQQHIATVNNLQTESLSATEQLQKNIRQDVDTIRFGADHAASLDALKVLIDGRLREIQMNVKIYFDVERKRFGEARDTSQSLYKRLDELTAETEQLRESLRETTARIYQDVLTGIANRLSYDERITQEHTRWRRYGGSLTLMVIDIDHFKSVNDRFGHSTGDALLQSVAAAMQHQLRDVDFIARYGGEEFVVVMPETSLADAGKVAEKLRASVETCQHRYQQTPYTVTISGGLSEFRKGDTPAQVFKRADACLYLAKRNGRNRIILDPSCIKAVAI